MGRRQYFAPVAVAVVVVWVCLEVGCAINVDGTVVKQKGYGDGHGMKKRPSEYVPMATKKNDYTTPLPHEYLGAENIPKNWDWRNVDGKSYVTKLFNQHIPQYCGSCWLANSVSSFADRIKIARDGKGDEVNLAAQFVLNCGTKVAGSCHGGDHLATYQFIKETGFIPYETCLQYEACSAESTEGNCKYGNYECNSLNTCRTCSTFAVYGGFCSGIDYFPNASIAEYGQVSGADRMKAEIYARGPISCGINANFITNYTGGVVDLPEAAREIDHIVSIVGWSTNPDGSQAWIIRNSWGVYWGEMGFFRVKLGENQLGIEQACAWATPHSFTEVNFPCYEDGSNCIRHTRYVDPGLKYAQAAEE